MKTKTITLPLKDWNRIADNMRHHYDQGRGGSDQSQEWRRTIALLQTALEYAPEQESAQSLFVPIGDATYAVPTDRFPPQPLPKP